MLLTKKKTSILVGGNHLPTRGISNEAKRTGEFGEAAVWRDLQEKLLSCTRRIGVYSVRFTLGAVIQRWRIPEGKGPWFTEPLSRFLEGGSPLPKQNILSEFNCG